MSKAKVVEACLGGFGVPLFPSTIDLLNTTLGEIYGLGGFVLKEVGDMVEGFVGKWRPTTTDGYTWFWALTFTRGGGTIVVCFPRDGRVFNPKVWKVITRVHLDKDFHSQGQALQTPQR